MPVTEIPCMRYLDSPFANIILKLDSGPVHHQELETEDRVTGEALYSSNFFVSVYIMYKNTRCTI